MIDRSAHRIQKLPKCIQSHITEGDPCWSVVPTGWHDLIEQLHTHLVAINPKYEIKQVKEKFGSLRYYTDFAYDEHDLATIVIGHYTERSAHTCVACGKYDYHDINIKPNDRGWLIPKCDSCREKK